MENGLYFVLFWVSTITIIEAIAMSIIEYSANNNNNYYILGVFIYIIVPLILYKLLLKGSLSIINSLWNVSSIILVTMIGLTFFKDKVTKYKIMGILFALSSIICMEYDNIEKFIKQMK